RRICRRDWNVIDVGANHGIYSLSLAHVGAAHVWAFEPTSEPLVRFRESVELNGLGDRITILQQALSSEERPGVIYLGKHSELSSSAVNPSCRIDGAIENVEFVSLDYLAATLPLPSIDFLKLDAEGEEMAILDGGKAFFETQSPLVMFEFMECGRINPALVVKFRALGYGVYALVPGLSCLRPVAEGEERELDPMVLNLFACKPDRAKRLEMDGALFQKLRADVGVTNASAIERLLSLPFVDEDLRECWSRYEFSTPYGRAALAWSASLDADRPPAERYASLLNAQLALVEAVQSEDFHPAVTVLLTRVLADLGLQEPAMTTAFALLEQIGPADIPTDRPVPPALAMFDMRQPRSTLSAFLYQSMLEFHIARRAHTGFFGGADEPRFAAAMSNPERTPELERRVVLEVISGNAMKCGRGLRWLFGEDENRNLEIWARLLEAHDFYPVVEGVDGETLLERGDQAFSRENYLEAYRCYRQAADQQAAVANAEFKVGVALMRLERARDAAEWFRAALCRQPAYWPACNNLGLVLTELHDDIGAEQAYRSGIAENVAVFDLHYNLASLLKDTGRFVEALYYLRQAELLRPDMACVPDKIGSTLILMSRTNEAIPVLQRALELAPDWGQAWNNLGRCHFIRGNLDEAERCYREAVRHAPSFLPAWTNRVMTMNYRSHDPDAVFALHREYGAKAREVAGEIDRTRWRVHPERTRRLRVGFVSGDFRRHSVSYFVEGVLRHLDRRHFQPYAYFSHGHPDSRTLEFKPMFSLWRDVKDLSDAELAERIVADRIDILVDLIGHTTGTRLAVFAEKPAPLQLTWIGYPNTTGLDSIDYRLTDAVVDPPGFADTHCTEKLWRLPRPFLCYAPPPHAPEVRESPVFTKGYITFGSFNSRFKIGDETLALWSGVLQACPASRIIIKSPVGLADAEARMALRQRLLALGVDDERIDIQEGIGDPAEHLDLYNSIDIALDPFPYHGTTTTFEALWMGVPVITQAGTAHVSRVGVSILEYLGLPELVARDAEAYVQLASELAADTDRLASLRASLRARLQASPLLDAKGMAADFGNALREMWSCFCDSRSAADLAALPQNWEAPSPIRLHVGGREPRAGWKILDVKPGPGVDYVADVRDLSAFEEGSCAEIYCSHVLEYLGMGDILPVLENFHRMLVPGGRLSISVPDIDTLSWLMLSPQYSKAAKFEVMRRMFGGQHDEFDFHSIGLNLDFLCDYLHGVGFSAIEHVESLGIFDDASEEASFNGISISLNLIATR
ncbi:MAG: protein O-GlcNAc transferase, partial [Pseudomonadota bacterium]|nr:protein O-GlcNAc transferase [Pseudomonadota bacterium]